MIPAVIKFQKHGVFSSREFHFCTKFTLIFGIPEIRTILKPRECKAEGVSFLSVKLFVDSKLSHFEGELQTEKIPAVIKIPKI